MVEVNLQSDKSPIEKAGEAIGKIFKKSLIKLIIFIFWALFVYIIVYIFYVLFLVILWGIINEPGRIVGADLDNPYTTAFWNIMRNPMLFVFVVGLIYMVIVLVVFLICWVIWNIFQATVIFSWIPFIISPIFQALDEEGIFKLFDILFSNVDTKYKIKKIYNTIPFLPDIETNDEQYEDDVKNPFDEIKEIQEFKKTINNTIVYKNGKMYYEKNNVNKLSKMGPRIKIKDSKSNDNKTKKKPLIKFVEPKELSKEQKDNINRCISSSVKSFPPDATPTKKMQIIYDNQIIKTNCEKKYDGRNRQPSENHLKNSERSIDQVSNVLNNLATIFTNNDFDY